MFVRSSRPLAPSASSMCPMPASTSASDLTRELGADAAGVRGAVRIVQPHEGDVGMDLVEPQRQVGVDGVTVLRVVRRRMRRRGTEPRRGADRQVRREGELGMHGRAAAGRVIEHERRSARPAADHEHLPAGSLEDFAERRRRQQRAVGAFGGFEVCPCRRCPAPWPGWLSECRWRFPSTRAFRDTTRSRTTGR